MAIFNSNIFGPYGPPPPPRYAHVRTHTDLCFMDWIIAEYIYICRTQAMGRYGVTPQRFQVLQ
jgi:hypothetical protein